MAVLCICITLCRVFLPLLNQGTCFTLEKSEKVALGNYAGGKIATIVFVDIEMIIKKHAYLLISKYYLFMCLFIFI